ncbi:hypothetical protein FOA52_001979 [Chlamydomonas sp. UWO 241]|nr:hypothetical protein FOA52_001979 [Chlamydomonas sp. UWO 241]
MACSTNGNGTGTPPPPPNTTCVFSFGSNSTKQLRERVRPGSDEAFLTSAATLPGHCRVFAGSSKRWGGSVAAVYPCEGESVNGMVVCMTDAELKILDTYEGDYERAVAAVNTWGWGKLDVLYYKKTNLAYKQPPSVAYLAAIATMLAEAGHDTTVTINHVHPGDGSVITTGSWSPQGGLDAVMGG